MNFSEIVKKARNNLGWSFSRLEDELKKKGVSVSVATLSRIESGSPPKRSNVRKALIEVLEINPLDYSGDGIRVGFGHCVWATPVLHSIVNDNLEGIMFTSKSSNSSTPHFVNLDSLEESIIEKSDLLYNANNLLGLLKNNKLDCVIIPGELYSDNKDYVERAASIMYTSDGDCELLSLCSNEKILHHSSLVQESSLTLSAFKNLVTICDNQNIGISLLYSPDTISQKYLNKYVIKHCEKLSNAPELISAETDDFSILWNHIIKAELKKKKLILFIGWNPHIYWIKEKLRTWETQTQIKLYQGSNEIGKIFEEKKSTYLSFDIMFNRNKRWGDVELTTRFFDSIHNSVKKINDFLNEYRNSTDGMGRMLKIRQEEGILMAKKYFEYKGNQTDPSGSDPFIDSIKNLNFRFNIYYEWYEKYARK